MLRRAQARSLLTLCAVVSCSTDNAPVSPRDAAVGMDATLDGGLPSLAEDPATPQGCPPPGPIRDISRAMRVSCDAQRARGPLAMARNGDVVIENAWARFILRSGDESATTIGAPGGGVIDASELEPARPRRAQGAAPHAELSRRRRG